MDKGQVSDKEGWSLALSPQSLDVFLRVMGGVHIWPFRRQPLPSSCEEGESKSGQLFQSLIK